MPNDKMSGHFAFWCHISTTLTFSSTPPFVGRIIKQPEGLIHESKERSDAIAPKGAVGEAHKASAVAVGP